jgi:hypothetical protein
MAKLSTDDLVAAHSLASQWAPVGSLWQHYKGGVYRITGHAFDTEREAMTVLYERLAGPGFVADREATIRYSRPLLEWSHTVTVAGRATVRFKRLG